MTKAVALAILDAAWHVSRIDPQQPLFREDEFRPERLWRTAEALGVTKATCWQCFGGTRARVPLLLCAS